jgi:hypothetical protein
MTIAAGLSVGANTRSGMNKKHERDDTHSGKLTPSPLLEIKLMRLALLMGK